MQIDGPKIYGVILAAGKARRQGPVCFERPKILLPCGNRVLGDFAVEAMKKAGLSNIHIVSSPRNNSDQIERHFKPEIYKLDIQVENEPERRDTLGTIHHLIGSFDIKPKDTIIMAPSDEVYDDKLDFGKILKAHEDSKAAITAVGYHIPWSSTDWVNRTFGVIQFSGMPDLRDYSNRSLFEEDVKNFLKSFQGQSLPITGFHEKEKRERAQSNVIYTGILVINAEALMVLAPFITKPTAEYPLCNEGLHGLPIWAGRGKDFEHCSFRASRSDYQRLCKRIKAGEFPFYAHLLPFDSYWRDVPNPLSLMKVNMDALDRKFSTQLDSVYWHNKEWGWQGNFGTVISPEAVIKKPAPGTIGCLIGSHVDVSAGVELDRSVVGDYTTIRSRSNISNSIIFPGTPFQKGRISSRTRMINCLYVGGNTSLTSKDLVDKIIIKPKDGEVAVYPLSETFATE